MPTVPKYNKPVVAQQDLPGVRLNASSSADAFGGGESRDQVARSQQVLSQSIKDIFTQEKKNADQLAVLDADQKMSAIETSTLYDPQSGALNKKGKDAFGIPDQVRETFNTQVKDIEGTLANDDQKTVFKRLAISRLNDMDRQVMRHVSSEITKFDENVTESFLANERDAAAANYHDGERVGLSIERQRGALLEQANRNGLPEEWVKLKTDQAVSKTHVEVISRMLANGEDLNAKAYYDSIRGVPNQKSPGLISSGNIDLTNRPQVKNADGSVSTVRSMSVNLDGQEILLPTVSEDGKNLTKDEAIQQYKETGKHLGIFKDSASSDKYAQNLHNAQARALKGGLTGGDAIHIEKALEEGTLRGESQRITDSILKDPSIDKKRALDLAREVKDPKVRDEVERRVIQRMNQDEAAIEATRKQLYGEAVKLVESTPGLSEADVRNKVPPTTWANLSPEQKRALEARASNPANDDKSWLSFMDLPPGQLASMSKEDFEIKYWSKFDHEHRSRAESMWGNAREAGNKAALDPKLTNVLNAHEQLINTIKSSNLIDPNKSVGKYSEQEVVFMAQMESAAAKKVEEFELTQLGGKRKATFDERQKIFDDVTIKKVFIEKAWSTDKEKPAALITDEDKKGGTVFYVPINKIPEPDKNSISNLFRSRNKKITERKLERAYGAYLLNDRKLLDQIVGE